MYCLSFILSLYNKKENGGKRRKDNTFRIFFDSPEQCPKHSDVLRKDLSM